MATSFPVNQNQPVRAGLFTARNSNTASCAVEAGPLPIYIFFPIDPNDREMRYLSDRVDAPEKQSRRHKCFELAAPQAYDNDNISFTHQCWLARQLMISRGLERSRHDRDTPQAQLWPIALALLLLLLLFESIETTGELETAKRSVPSSQIMFHLLFIPENPKTSSSCESTSAHALALPAVECTIGLRSSVSRVLPCVSPA